MNVDECFFQLDITMTHACFPAYYPYVPYLSFSYPFIFILPLNHPYPFLTYPYPFLTHPYLSLPIPIPFLFLPIRSPPLIPYLVPIHVRPLPDVAS
jgi:hypothetical protein